MWRNSMEIFHLIYEKQMTRGGISEAMKGNEWEVSDRWDWCCTEPELISFALVFTEEVEGHIPETGIHFHEGEKMKC